MIYLLAFFGLSAVPALVFWCALVVGKRSDPPELSREGDERTGA